MARHFVLAISCVVGFALLGVVYGLSQSSSTSATASIVVTDPNTSSSNGNAVDANYTADQAAILRLPSTADAAATIVNKKISGQNLTGTDITNGLAVKLETTSDLISVSYSSSDPAVAAAGANAVVQAYQTAVAARARQVNADTQRQIDAAIQTLTQRIQATNNNDPASPDRQTLAELQSRRLELIVNASVSQDGIVASSPATLPSGGSKSGSIRYGILGLIAGVLIGAVASYIVANRRRRINGRLEPELLLERPFLAEIPDFSRERLPSDLPSFDSELSAAAEGFRFAADALESGRTYAVISAVSGDGKSVTAANIAMTAAKSGRRVLVMDGNLDGQGLSWLLGIAGDRPGLVQLARGDVELAEAVSHVKQVKGTLDVLSPGMISPGLGEPFGSEQVAKALEAARRTYDLIIVDAPALLERAAGSVLAKQVDSTLIVVPHSADVAVLEEFAKRVRLLRLPVLGYLYTRSQPPRGNGGRGPAARLALPSRRDAPKPSVGSSV
jgi:Mrp family chromosome partitioning ATPase